MVLPGGTEEDKRHQDISNQDNNTPSPVFCDLAREDLFKNHDGEKVACSQFAYQWVRRKTDGLLI